MDSAPQETTLPSGSLIAAALFERSVDARRSKAASKLESAPPTRALTVRKHVCCTQTTLVFAGAFDVSTLAQIRDEAFTAIGSRPKRLCLDVMDAESPDATALDSLVTIANVARIMGVEFCIRAPVALVGILETTNLSRLIPVDNSDEARLSSDSDAPMESGVYA